MGFKYELARFIPFRDEAASARVRAITREEITRHSNPDFHIRVMDDPAQFYFDFALDIVSRIRQAADERRPFIGIFPVGPMPQYAFAAKLINQTNLSLKHVHTFNMDEYADENGNTAPLDWPGSFQKAMWANFFGLIKPAGGYGWGGRLLRRYRLVRTYCLLGGAPGR
jgi:glucosamine-6-phosphate deaminase